MAPDDPGEKGDGDHGEGHRVVAEDRLARERRKDIRGRAHRGQDEDVHLRMAKEPEKVLPQQRLAASFGEEEAGAEHAIEQEHRQGRRENRQREQKQDGGNEERPDDQRHAKIGHPGRPHVDDCRDIVDGAHQRG